MHHATCQRQNREGQLVGRTEHGSLCRGRHQPDCPSANKLALFASLTLRASLQLLPPLHSGSYKGFDIPPWRKRSSNAPVCGSYACMANRATARPFITFALESIPRLGSGRHASIAPAQAIGYLSSPNSTICKAFPLFLKPNYSGAALPIKLSLTADNRSTLFPIPFRDHPTPALERLGEVGHIAVAQRVSHSLILRSSFSSNRCACR